MPTGIGLIPSHHVAYGPKSAIKTMGFNVELQDEFGGCIARVDDPLCLLDKLMPELGDESYPFLGSIDPYGDTTFNGLQMRRFLKEWDTVRQEAKTADEETLIAAVEELARRCRDEVHTYLKFIGD